MSALALLAEARAAGVTLRLADGRPKVGGTPSPELLARLRAAKSELVELLNADRCRHCGERIDWSEAGARAFADGMGAHDPCWREAEIDRHLRNGARAVDARHAADPGEVALRGELP